MNNNSKPYSQKGKITTHPFAKSKNSMNQHNGRKTIDTGASPSGLVLLHPNIHIRLKTIIQSLGEIKSHSCAEYVKPIY